MERALVQKETALIISDKSHIVRQFFAFHWNIGLKEIITPHVTLFLKQLEEKNLPQESIIRPCRVKILIVLDLHQSHHYGGSS
jgi:hypothetical protein